MEYDMKVKVKSLSHVRLFGVAHLQRFVLRVLLLGGHAEEIHCAQHRDAHDDRERDGDHMVFEAVSVLVGIHAAAPLLALGFDVPIVAYFPHKSKPRPARGKKELQYREYRVFL